MACTNEPGADGDCGMTGRWAEAFEEVP